MNVLLWMFPIICIVFGLWHFMEKDAPVSLYKVLLLEIFVGSGLLSLVTIGAFING